MSKTEQINFAIQKVQEILNIIRPENNWKITYSTPENIEVSDWDRTYHGLINKEDYFFIWIGQKLHYTVNVTGDSVLTAIQELINKLALKF